jgi:galactonate dehydratase
VVPNFLIQEQVDDGLGAGLLREPWKVKDGHIELPTRPGLGFEIDEKEAAQSGGLVEEELGGEFYHEADGSVVDW